MAKITDAQAQEIIDDNDAMKKEINGSFDCFYLSGMLSCCKYFVSESDTNILPPDSDEATVKARMKVLLKLQDFRGENSVTDQKV